MEPTATEPQILSDEKVRFSIHHKPGCIVEFDVEVLAPLISEAEQIATKQVAKQVTLPGFRKGKAPDERVKKEYRKEVEKQSEQIIGELAFKTCMKLAQIPLLHKDAQASFKIKSRSKEGALLTFSFETEPTLPSIDPKELKLKAVKRPEVNEKTIAETIRQIQFFFAEWKSILDRPVAEGDFVLLDVDVIEEMPPKPLFSHTRFEVAEHAMAKWMYDLVIGKQVGETVEGISIPDADASSEDKEALQPKKVRLTVKAIDHATLPPLDDEFATKVGLQTVEELHTHVTQLLNRQADAHVQEALREQASHFLLNHYTFSLPASLIQKETQFRFKQLLNDPDFLRYWKPLNKEDQNKTIMTIYQQAERAVRMHYLCRQLIADAHLRISAQDVPAAPTTTLEMLLSPQKMFHHQQNPEVEQAEAYSRLLLEKAEDYLIANASSE